MALRKVGFATEFLCNDNDDQTYRQVREKIIPEGVAVWIGRKLRFNEELLRDWAAKGGTPLNDSQNSEAQIQGESLAATT